MENPEILTPKPKTTLISRLQETLKTVKQEARPFFRYKQLKLKEYFSRLNQNEFDELLALDMQEAFRDIPPIKRVFAPKRQLTRIKSLPRSKKLAALTAFKEQYVRQQEAWTRCRLLIEKSLEFNHDTHKRKLNQIIDAFASRYGFTQGQRRIAGGVIDGYFANRRKALEFRNKYPNDVDLVNALTGLNFDKTTRLEVRVGPMSLDIATDRFTVARIYHRYQNTKTFSLGGFATFSLQTGYARGHYFINRVPYTVVIDAHENRQLSQKTQIHEHEHHKNKLLREFFDTRIILNETSYFFSIYKNESSPEIKKTALENYLRLLRQHALDRAKDEIIAYKKERPNWHNCSIFFRRDNGSYDYLSNLRNWQYYKNDPLWQTTSNQVLVDEYRKIIEKAVDAFEDLMKKGRYSPDETISLLTDKPLIHWPSAARTLLDRKDDPNFSPLRKIFTSPLLTKLRNS